MTQHMATARTSTGYRTACGRTVDSGRATSWQQTTCAACKRSAAWWKASEQ